jgi:hypothetical protein
MLPISVLLPTRNAMALLPGHLESMRAWADLVEEVVAVDSHSTDGTLELLRSEKAPANTRVLTHPPGLYQSWNFGIAQCRAKYLYISTVGDTITRAGLEALFLAAEKFSADVVISPPRMLEVSGKPKVKIWPVHALVEQANWKQPFALAPAAVQLFAVANLLRGILGSSASNLYRTEILQRFPFRTDFGTAGDLAWGLEHGGKIRLAIVPETFSTFVFHPKSYAKSDYEVAEFNEQCLVLARDSIARATGRTDSDGEHSAEPLVARCVKAWGDYEQAKRSFNDQRRSMIWWASSAAWRAKRARDVAEERLTATQDEAHRFIARSARS